jgi:choline dehydrogenase-like flavoprotein
MHLNLKAKDKHTYDAIVVGSGISGGWAAKELCEGGLKTLLLERGRDVQHIHRLPHGHQSPLGVQAPRPGDARRTRQIPRAEPYRLYDQRRHEALFRQRPRKPYLETKRFDWIRGYHLGGRSLMWGRQSYRYSDLDFEANAKEGIAADWPIRYRDLAPWYDHVERFAGINGERDGLDQLPDGVMQPPMPLNCIEEHVMTTLNAKYPHKRIIKGRAAHLTQPTPEQTALGPGLVPVPRPVHAGLPVRGVLQFAGRHAARRPAARATLRCVRTRLSTR